MWYVPGKLHDASLRIMRRLMHCMLLLPPRPQVELKVLYTIVLLLYLIFVLYSEVVLLMRFSEFTMYSSLILCFYRDLCKVSTTLIADLESTSPEMCSVRYILLDRLFALQHLHGLLWNSTRLIEQNFELSLISIMLKLLVNTSMLPYWIFINATTTKSWAIIQCVYPEDNRFYIAKCISLADCVADQLCQLVEIIVQCLICTRCERIYRPLKALFHTLSSDRQNTQLNLAVMSISSRLQQERCLFSAGGMFCINNVTLGKVSDFDNANLLHILYLYSVVVYFRRGQLLRHMHTISHDFFGEIIS